jgi:hypothetical protein
MGSINCGFFDSAPEEASFRDHLLHEDHGLCVIITVVFGKRYILLKNEEVSIQHSLNSKSYQTKMQ